MKLLSILRKFYALTLIIFIASSSHLHAQTMPEEEEIQTVEVKGIKDSSIIPYKKAYELTEKINVLSSSHVQLLFNVTNVESKNKLKI